MPSGKKKPLGAYPILFSAAVHRALVMKSHSLYDCQHFVEMQSFLMRPAAALTMQRKIRAFAQTIREARPEQLRGYEGIRQMREWLDEGWTLQSFCRRNEESGMYIVGLCFGPPPKQTGPQALESALGDAPEKV